MIRRNVRFSLPVLHCGMENMMSDPRNSSYCSMYPGQQGRGPLPQRIPAAESFRVLFREALGAGHSRWRSMAIVGALLLALLFVLPLPEVSHAKDTRRFIRPTIGEPVVRQWFDAISLSGFRRVALFHEFHPIDGSLVGRYMGAGNRAGSMLFVTYMDEERKDPEFGMFRTAKEMVSVGATEWIERRTLNGHVWFGDDSDKPTAATDLGPKVRVVLVGYEGVELTELFELAESLELSILEDALD